MDNILYYFYNASNEIIYIGKTTNFKSRMSQHFNKKEMETYKWKQEIKYIKLFFFENPIDMSIYEIYLINKHNPKYNLADNYKNYNSTMYLPENKVFTIISDINDIVVKEPNMNIKCNKKINLIYPKRRVSNRDKKLHTYEFVSKNLKKVGNSVMNIRKNVIKNKSDEIAFKLVFPNLFEKLKIRWLSHSIDTLQDFKKIKTIMYVGFICLDSKPFENSLEYNYCKIIELVNDCFEESIDLYISCDILRDFVENKITNN